MLNLLMLIAAISLFAALALLDRRRRREHLEEIRDSARAKWEPFDRARRAEDFRDDKGLRDGAAERAEGPALSQSRLSV